MNKLQSLIESGLIDREDGTIFDTRTNLLWQKSPSSWKFTWEKAIDHCKSLIFAGYDDWRLPTIEELEALINIKYNPTIDPIFECESSSYWSSSTVTGNPYDAWFVYFGIGRVYDDNKIYNFCVRAVRG